MDPCGTPQEISPKSESFFTRNILSERYDLNHFMVLSENLIGLSFCNKISWSVVSNAFCRSINISVNKPSSNPCQTLLKFYLLGKTNIDLLNDNLENLIDSYTI